jgi:hypothetical protein
VSTTEELLERKSSGSGLENQVYGCRVSVVKSLFNGFRCVTVIDLLSKGMSHPRSFMISEHDVLGHAFYCNTVACQEGPYHFHKSVGSWVTHIKSGTK